MGENDTAKNLQAIYPVIVTEMHDWLKRHQNLFAFYSSLNSALVSATIVGLYKGWGKPQLLAIVAGPILIIFLSCVALKGTGRAYRNLLDTLTMRKKIEEELGLTLKDNRTASPNTSVAKWLCTEPIIPTRHIESGGRGATSEQWVKYHLRENNYNRLTKIFFRAFLVLGVVLLLVVLWGSIDSIVGRWGYSCCSGRFFDY